MALLGRRQPSDKQPAKGSSKKSAPAKRGSKVASIADVNKATSAIEEEPTTDEPQLLRTKQPAPAPLTGSKNAAYGGFSTDTYSETAAQQRKNSIEKGDVDEFAVEHEVGVVYVDESGRQFYFDEYGTQHFADEVAPAPDIPASFEEARNSSSREKFQKEAEQARTAQAAAVNAPPAGYGAPAESYGSAQPPAYPPPGYNPAYDQQPPAGTQYGQGFPGGYGAPQPGYSAPPSGGVINHGEGVPTVSLANAPHVENPFLEGSREINAQIEQGVVADNFPVIATTIASLVNSSKSSDDITRTLLGYIQTTLAGEGSDATLKLLGTDNIYAPLLVSALLYNLQQHPIQPVALREVWDVKPEIKIEEKIVYVKDNSAPRDGEKGFWISTEGIDDDAAPSPIYEKLTSEFDSIRREPQPLNYAHLDY